MKKLIFAFIILIGSLNALSQKSDLFKYDKDGNITMEKTVPIKNNFQYTTKRALAGYANDYNGKIIQEANKLKDYIIYEDSSAITAIIKFQATQLLQDILWQGMVDFKKQGDSVRLVVSRIKVAKVQNLIVGDAVTDSKNSLEIADKKRYKSALKKLKDRIDYFLSLFS